VELSEDKEGEGEGEEEPKEELVVELQIRAEVARLSCIAYLYHVSDCWKVFAPKAELPLQERMILIADTLDAIVVFLAEAPVVLQKEDHKNFNKQLDNLQQLIENAKDGTFSDFESGVRETEQTFKHLQALKVLFEKITIFYLGSL